VRTHGYLTAYTALITTVILLLILKEFGYV
jgi:hypothetical protein